MWLDLALLSQAALLGLWGSIHCAAMCGPLCSMCLPGDPSVRPGSIGQTGMRVAAWIQPRLASDQLKPVGLQQGLPRGLGRFVLARIFSYGLLGILISASAGALRDMAALAAWVKPLWLGVHVMLLMAGLWLAASGRWIDAGEATGGWLGRQVRRFQEGTRERPAWRLGFLWGLWPCGVLYGALMLASLTNHPLLGGFAMMSFALTSSPGLSLGAWMAQGAKGTTSRVPAWLVRSSGLLIAGGALWALAHDALVAVIAWCIA